jgi:hypothetical protein
VFITEILSPKWNPCSGSTRLPPPLKRQSRPGLQSSQKIFSHWDKVFATNWAKFIELLGDHIEK